MPSSSALFYPIHLHRSTSGPPHGSTQFQNQRLEQCFYRSTSSTFEFQRVWTYMAESV
ncbi:hypothetical protein ES319_D03G164400v1 [Gossypium barbadense]|uniref:Uncharacterized protein n=2 Tax=Gossypium TaxID=3633 RepID=A0A5J5S893_GOSBA|nr:hypothetical protein ES319_D03G164400v1 [Gossypium barbadense]TYH81080.1 hypothetical protein ES332_D03G174500v1 [Gossypium tomentosum]